MTKLFFLIGNFAWLLKSRYVVKGTAGDTQKAIAGVVVGEEGERCWDEDPGGLCIYVKRCKRAGFAAVASKRLATKLVDWIGMRLRGGGPQVCSID